MSGESYGNVRVDAALDALKAESERDFVLLAMAALDQAGLSVANQKILRAVVECAFGPIDQHTTEAA